MNYHTRPRSVTVALRTAVTDAGAQVERHRDLDDCGDAMRPGAVNPVEALSGGAPRERPGRGISWRRSDLLV